MSEQKPDAVWVFPEEPKKRGGRIALIVGLVVLVLLAAGVVALFVVPRGGGALGPTASPSTSRTAMPSPSVSPTQTDAPTAVSVPTAPATTPPPQPDPSITQFRNQVGFRLGTASEGLDMIAQGASDNAQTVAKLQEDAQRLSDTPPPSSIADAWRSDLQNYTGYLAALSANSSDSGALLGARDAVGSMKSLVGA